MLVTSGRRVDVDTVMDVFERVVAERIATIAWDVATTRRRLFEACDEDTIDVATARRILETARLPARLASSAVGIDEILAGIDAALRERVDADQAGTGDGAT